MSREFDSQLFVQQNPVFEWGMKYKYERCSCDENEVGTLVAEHLNDDNSLNKEARK